MASGGSVISAEESGKWWADLSKMACVKNCPISSSNVECGGEALSWEGPFFETSEDCCRSKLWWIELHECAASAL